MIDFQSRYRMTLIFAQPIKLFIIGNLKLFRHPTLTLAQQPDKKRTATLDFIKTNLDHLALFVFFFGYAPMQININQMQIPLRATLTQFGKNKPDQKIPLRVHIAEGRGNKDSDCFPDSHSFLNTSWAFRFFSPKSLPPR